MASFCLCFTAIAHASGAAVGKGGEMVLIPAGDFYMGSPANGGYPLSETPRHKVYLNAFLIDKYEVTNRMFAEFLNAAKDAPEFEKKRKGWVVIRNDIDPEGKVEWWPAEIIFENNVYRAVRGFEQYPVISVSWHAAEAFCSSRGGRLPTEAEWEKAARGGLPDKDYPWGNEIPTVGIIFNRAWLNNFLPAPVEEIGNYYPNDYGIYDMIGNVSEWCADWYDQDYYSKSPKDNPPGPASGFSKVVRGGSWASKNPFLRVAFRNRGIPASQNSGIGFRCVMVPK